jgi:hypothetical protein
MPRLDIARGFEKAAEEASSQDRAVGAAFGSGISNFTTGTLASPFLFSKTRRFSPRRFRVRPLQHLKRLYGMEAIGSGLALSAVGALGGAIKEHTQAAWERRKTAAVSSSSSMSHSGDLLRVSAPVSAETGAETVVRRRASRGKGTALERFARSRNIKLANGDMMAYYQDLARRARAGDPKAKASLERRKRRDAELRMKRAYEFEDTVGPPPSEAEAVLLGKKRRCPQVRRVRAEAPEKVAGQFGVKRKTAAGKAWQKVMDQDLDEDAAESAAWEKAQRSGEVSRDVTSAQAMRWSDAWRRRHRVKQASQFGIMVYQRDPGELPESKRPPTPKGRVARMFGAKMHPGHALHRRSQRNEDKWMGEHGEFVEVGQRPGLADALQEVVGIEPNQVLSRKDVMSMVGEKRKAKSDAYDRGRRQRKAKQHAHSHAPEDLSELFGVFEQLLENPSAKYFQVVG